MCERVAAGLLTNTFLVRVGAATDCLSYDKAIESVLGVKALRMFQMLMVFSSFGSLCAYLILM